MTSKRLFILFCIVFSLLGLSPRFSYFTWDLSGSLVNFTGSATAAQNVFDARGNNFSQITNFRWTREGRLVKRKGWDISADSINLGTVKCEVSFPFYYSSSGTVALRTLCGGSDNKLYWRCLSGASCPGGSSTYYAIGSLDTFGTDSGNTWSIVQMNNKAVFSRGGGGGGGLGTMYYTPKQESGGVGTGTYDHTLGVPAADQQAIALAAGGTLTSGTAYAYALAFETWDGTIGGSTFQFVNANGNGITCSVPSAGNLSIKLHPTQAGSSAFTTYINLRVYRAKSNTGTCATSTAFTDFCYIGKIRWDNANAFITDNGTTIAGDSTGSYTYIVPDGDCLYQPYWNRVNNTSLPYTPCYFKYMAVWQARLWGAESTDGVSSGACSRGVVYFSDIAEPDAWTDINYRYIGKERGEKIQCLHAYNNRLFVGTDKASYFIVGDTADNYAVIPLSESVGCTSHWAVVEADGVLYWHYLDRVYSFDGNKLEDVGGIVRGLLDYNTTIKDHFAVFAVVDVPDREIWWFINEDGGTYTDALRVYNYEVGKWWEYDDAGASDVLWTSAFTPVNSRPLGYYSAASNGENKIITFENGYLDGVGLSARSSGAGTAATATLRTALFGTEILNIVPRKLYLLTRQRSTDCNGGSTATVTLGWIYYSNGRGAQNAVSGSSNILLTDSGGGSNGYPESIQTFVDTTTVQGARHWTSYSVATSEPCDIQPVSLTIQYTEMNLDE